MGYGNAEADYENEIPFIPTQCDVASANQVVGAQPMAECVVPANAASYVLSAKTHSVWVTTPYISPVRLTVPKVNHKLLGAEPLTLFTELVSRNPPLTEY